MSTSPHSFSRLPQGSEVLGELLHSLSQPLTSLRCSLELSIEEVAEQQQESVSVALEETEKVIGMIQLMREYLDAEQSGTGVCRVALAPVLRNVMGELSSIAAVREIQLRLAGSSMATLPVPQTRLRLALQYLIEALIEAQPAGGKVMLWLGEGPAGTVLRAADEHGFREMNLCVPERCAMSHPAKWSASPEITSASTSTLRRVRLAIASRVLETAGASLVFVNADVDHHQEVDSPTVDPMGFVLRIPRRSEPPA
jgi:signal transduction histidine kinase